MLARIGSYAIFPFLIFMLFMGMAPAQADQLASLNWNCWMDGHAPVRINCIHERAQPLPRNAPEDTDIELENQLRDQLKIKSSGRKAPILEGMEWKNIEILHEGAQWTIHIHAYPAGASLDESQINKVANAVLCPASTPCKVKVRAPIH